MLMNTFWVKSIMILSIHEKKIIRPTPTASILKVDPKDSSTKRNDATFTFGANESATFECAIDGHAFQSCNSPATFTDFTEGTHEFAVRAIDVAENTGQPVTYAWNVDLTPPAINLGNLVPEQQQ